MEISKFLNDQYADSALYINYRSTASFIDGLKNSTRKIVYTIKKQNIKNQMKVSALGSKVVDTSGYLHGDTSIQGAIVTLAQNFCGTNILPILEPIGSFGTRHIPEAAAPRYIFTKPSYYFDNLFKKEDDKNLIKQEFEGEEIEPMFYVPTVPLLLINGSTGIGVGFASTILSRGIDNVLELVKNFLNGKKSKDELYKPYWSGFKGEIIPIENNKWEIRGHIAEIKNKKVIIDELPISCTLSGYIKTLKKLKEKGVIEKYIDYSENDNFNFEITLTNTSDNIDKIMNDLKLVETITENLVCIDENNAVKEYESIKEIFKDFCKVKISFLEKRIASEIKRLEEELNYLENCYNFVTSVLSKKINISDKKTIVEKYLKDNGYEYIDKLMSMPISSLTEDKVKELKSKLEAKSLELKKMKSETPITIWKKDIEELEKSIKYGR